MPDDPRHIVRTDGLDWSQVWRGRHPFNPASEMQLVPLSSGTGLQRLGVNLMRIPPGKESFIPHARPGSSGTGLQRLGVNLMRIPPGKESFIPHAHTLQEEFVFILEGQGEMVLDGVGHPVGPGDFVGLPCDGVVHSLKAKGPGDLVYLTAGERGPVEIADMPSIGRTMVVRSGSFTMFGKDGAEVLTEAEWMARAAINRS